MTPNIVTVKPGKETSEYAVTQSAQKIGLWLAILGMVFEVAMLVLEGLSVVPDAPQWVGTAVALAGVGMKTATALGYQQARGRAKFLADETGATGAHLTRMLDGLPAKQTEAPPPTDPSGASPQS